MGVTQSGHQGFDSCCYAELVRYESSQGEGSRAAQGCCRGSPSFPSGAVGPPTSGRSRDTEDGAVYTCSHEFQQQTWK